MSSRTCFAFKMLPPLIAILLCGSFIDASESCPTGCECSQQSVRCDNVWSVPSIAADTRIIDLRNNRIRKLDRESFRGLQHVHTIHLSGNQLSFIEEDSFADLSSLRYLYLNDNRISKLSAKTFRGLDRLQSLYLQNNDIYHLNKESFVGLGGLKRLNLNHNRIRQIPIDTFEHLIALKSIRLDHNPVHCDCSMLGLSEWLQRLKPNDRSVTCQYPKEFEGRDLVSLDAATLECQNAHDDMEPVDSYDPTTDDVPQLDNGDMTRRSPQKPTIVLRPNGGKVSSLHALVLHCQAKGEPEPSISWLLNGRPVSDQQSTNAVRVLANGTLVIDTPSIEDSGEYSCEATNHVGSTKVRAEVTVQVPPIITIQPENQSVRIGDSLTLECDADGFPTPQISWLHDQQPLEIGSRFASEEENTAVTVEHVQDSDAGEYTCVAENEAGSARFTADIIVQSNVGSAPTLLIEPYDIEALPGSTIEMPCEGEGDPEPQIKWKKDGQTVHPSAKHRISASGSLHIKNIEPIDAGRYECSVWNQYGRTGNSGLLTVISNNLHPPGDRFVHIAYAEASREIGNAINQTIASLFGPPKNSFAPSTSQPRHHGELFKLFRYPTGEALELARAAEIYERTLVNIRRHVDAGTQLTANASTFDYKDIVSPQHLALVAELSGCQTHRIIPNCTNMCYHLKFRTMDGTCNNLQHSTWGASLTGFRRVLAPIYENGFSMPIGWTRGKLYHGFPKPSARLVSTEVITTKVITQDAEITHMVMQWGQFLDHDLDHAIPSVSSESWDGIDCKKSCDYAAPCYPIEVPPNDPRIKTRRCIDLVRSSAICGSGMTSVFFDRIQPREQINQHTSYIDASQVYGFTKQFSRDLRDLSNDAGRLRSGVEFPRQKSLLPFAAPTDGIDCRRNLEESNINCFTAGDIRVNEQIGLAAMHTIWLREHNRLAGELRRLNEHWDGETVYQEARKIVGAQMQHITYAHWLPNVLGEQGMRLLGEYRGYDPAIDPAISNEFATAALRFGHTLINPLLHRLNETFEPIAQGHLPLHKAFFAPWRLVHEGGVDPLLRGMFSVPAKLKLPQENLNQELTEKLFLTSHAVALDLAAINIQRARDHAIPGYNEYRRVCNLSVAETFDELSGEISSAEVREKLRTLYGHPGNVDLFVGGILEDPIEGARVGPLFRCLLIEQFRRLRDGDRLWYENPATFRPEQLSQIRTASLGAVLCNNGDNITEITDNVFHLPTIQGGYKRCDTLAQINLSVWLNCDKCSSHNVDSNVSPTISRQRRSVERENNEVGPQTTKTELGELKCEKMQEMMKVLDQMSLRVRRLEEALERVQSQSG